MPRTQHHLTQRLMLSYSHQGKSSTRFVRAEYVPQIKKELAVYKRFRQLTQSWVALELTLSQLRLEQACRDSGTGCERGTLREAPTANR